MGARWNMASPSSSSSSSSTTEDVPVTQMAPQPLVRSLVALIEFSFSSLNLIFSQVGHHHTLWEYVFETGDLLLNTIAYLELPQAAATFELRRVSRACSRICDVVTRLDMPRRFCRNQKKIEGGADEFIRRVVCACKNIDTISLASTCVTDAGLCELARHCRHLRAVDFRGCPYISEAGLRDLVTRCPNIRVLRVPGLAPGSSEGWSADAIVDCIAEHCGPQLEEADFETLNDITDAGVLRFARACPNLVGLTLDSFNLTDAAAHSLAQHCPSLEQVAFFNSMHLRNSGVQALAEHCTSLRDLALASCRWVGSAGVDGLGVSLMEALAPVASNLRTLDLRGCDVKNDDVKSIAQLCGSLEDLAVGSHRHLGTGLITDVAFMEIMQNCQYLQKVRFDDSYLTDLEVKKAFLAREWHTLTHIDLGYTHVGSRAVKELAKHCGMRLQKLCVGGCFHMVDAGLRALAKHCRNLTDIDLQSTSIRDPGIVALAKGCVKLKFVDLGETRVSGSGLRQLALSCTELERLVLNYCDGVNKKGLLHLFHHAQRLQWLSLFDLEVEEDLLVELEALGIDVHGANEHEGELTEEEYFEDFHAGLDDQADY